MNRLTMSAKSISRGRASAGFTLIELMVTVVVASILVAIAVPTYTAQIRKSRRTDAKTALLDLAGREERYFSTNNGAYTAVAASLGYSGAFPVTVGSGYYTIAAPIVTLGTAAAVATFTITATPAGTQVNDAACTSFTINNLGQQTALGSDPNPNVDCWK
ncbi:MAG: type IV pilin protein [Steroidobacteraceae bacterium]